MTPTPTDITNGYVVTPTGSDDTTALQAAIDALTLPASDKRNLVLFLDGEFRISDTLRVGGLTVNAPLLRGCGQAVVNWHGPMCSKPMLDYQEISGFAVSEAISSLLFMCRNRARGIILRRVTYAGGMRHVGVIGAREVGVDLVDCWGTEVSHLVIQSTKGIGLRAVGFNSSHLHTVKITGDGTDWPDPLDETVQRYNGDYVRTAENERAAMIVTGGIAEISNICFEAYDAPGLPLLRQLGRDGFVHGIRREKCDVADDWARVDGHQQQLSKA